MISAHLQDNNEIERYLLPNEEILWEHPDGRLPTHHKLLLWLAIPLTLVWIMLGIRELFGPSGPGNIPTAITVIVAIGIVVWGGLLLWIIKQNLPRNSEIVFVVTNSRVLVVNLQHTKIFRQARLDSLGNISVSSDRHGETLTLQPYNCFQMNPFFNDASKWSGLSNANHVKSIIENRKADIAQETQQ